MPQINSYSFGEIIIDNKQYHQVLIIGEEVEERDWERLEKEFGTTHRIGEWEKEKLLSNNPEVIIIGTGHQGVLKIDPSLIDLLRKKGIEFFIALTPKAIDIYNQKIKEKRKVNALIHTTC